MPGLSANDANGEPPAWLEASPLLVAAFRLADASHSRSAGETEIGHPVAVARLLHDEGFGDEVVAAALLHDVVEDTGVDLNEIAVGFGPEICALVREMTENAGIESYPERKAEHRDRVARSRRVAAIYAADKVASTRDLDAADDTSAERLRHFQETLKVLRQAHPDLPFLHQLGVELERLGQQPG